MEPRPPPPEGLSTGAVPSSTATRSVRPRSPSPAGRVRAADAVVGDVDRHEPVDPPHGDVASDARAYLATFASASATTK